MQAYFSAVCSLRCYRRAFLHQGRQTRAGWGKQAIFQRYASISRKLVGFPLTPRSMTLDDLELQLSSNFRRISQIWEAITANRIIDQYCQRQRCNQLNVLFNTIGLFPALVCRTDFFARAFALHTRTAVACRALTLALADWLSCPRKSYVLWNCKNMQAYFSKPL